jgi:chemotaxis protein methyltransferase CheR
LDKETAPVLLNANFDYLRQIVFDHSSVVLEAGKEYLAEARLLPIVRERQMASLDQLIQELRQKSSPDLHREVVEAMLTNETSFFRDVKPFEILRDLVLPDLISIKVPDRTLNIWCAACSGGQEVYSLLMVLKEYFPILEGWKLRVIASDLSSRMLDKARRGIYSQLEVNRGMPENYLVKYFDEIEREWKINETLRNAVEFIPLNLAKPWPFLPAMDLILMRNVMIYFDVETKKRVLNQTADLLKPHGYLFLGGAESTINLTDQFERMAWPQASCFRRFVNK